MLLHPSVQMMLLLLLGSQIAPVRMRRPHRLLYNHSGGKRAGNKTKPFFRQSDCCHVNNRQGNKGGISTGILLGVMRQRNKGCLRREAATNKAGTCFKAHQMDLSLHSPSRS
ncbi:hypothetical protein QQF64_035085 [Cirrhinus molitorella]|uniref:Secreted protein n=1 Tax=Cirrhinus molitorella TaxID=172907 RepID=A0ABR3NES3_9TELE